MVVAGNRVDIHLGENRPMQLQIACSVLLLLLATGGVDQTAEVRAAEDAVRIQPYHKNRYYWQYHGRPVLLLGGSVEDNLFQTPHLKQQLDRLKAAGGNYVRNTMSSRDKGNVWPFRKVGDKYDLNQWNVEYWKRFETFLRETARRDIFVQIEIWATFDYYRDPWFEQNPFCPKNNINYTAKQSGLKNRVNSHPLRLKNPFVRSVPSEQNLKTVLNYQRRFVAEILEHSLKYDHVLYCMDNETAASPAWSKYWVRFIRERAAAAGTKVETTEMLDPWNIQDVKHNRMFHHPELYTFVDISQNNHNKGERHYLNALKRRRQIRKRPRPMNNVKIYGADTGRYGKARDGIERFWRNIFCGLASARFHRPDSGLGLSALAQQNIRSARQITAAFDLFSCNPHNDLLANRAPNEAFCLANPGREYAVYFPGAGDVQLNFPGRQDQAYRLRWYAIDHGKWSSTRSLSAKTTLRLQTPGRGQWAAIITRPATPTSK